MGRFDGQVCLIPGGARGIGAKTAELYVHDGGKAAVGDINPDEGKELVDHLGGDNVVLEQLDVRDPASCGAFVERAVDAFGAVDHLVNCAIRIKPGGLAELSLEDWQDVVDIGLTGTFLMCQAVGRWLIDQDRPGAIVNLSSIGGRFPYGQAGAYSSVKGGVILLSQQLALEWAPHRIRVNVVAPAHVETPLTAYLQDPEVRRAREEVTPLGRVGQPEDIAHSILFLLSREADWTTGSVMDVDGGIGPSIMNHLKGRRWD